MTPDLLSPLPTTTNKPVSDDKLQIIMRNALTNLTYLDPHTGTRKTDRRGRIRGQRHAKEREPDAPRQPTQRHPA